MVLTPKWSCYGTDNKVIGRTWPKEDFLQQLQNFSELSGDRLTSPEHWWPIPNIPNISRLFKDRIVFDSLGRKRFQVWWEKAGLLSFRVGWLADGGGHTGVVFRWSPVPHFFPIQSQPNILSVSSLFASVFLFFLLLPIYISIQCMDSIPPFIHPFQFPPFRAPARCIYQCPLIAGECFQTFKWLELWWSWRLSWWWLKYHVGHVVRFVIY